MSIYTYNIANRISEALGIEPYEIPSLSDQELEKIPEEAKNKGVFGGETPTTWKSGHIPWNKGRAVTEEERQRLKKLCENRIPWNKGKTGLQKQSEEQKRNHSMRMKGRSLSKEHAEKIGQSQKGKPRPYLQRNDKGQFIQKDLS